MRIQQITPNYFQKSKVQRSEQKQNPSFSRLVDEDRFVKDLDKSPEFTIYEKVLAKKLVEFTRDRFNDDKYRDSFTRYMLVDADPKDSDIRGHKDRIALIIEGPNGTTEGLCIDPCIKKEVQGRVLGLNDIKELADDLAKWHDENYDSIKRREKIKEDEKIFYDDDDCDPFHGWIDPFVM